MRKSLIIILFISITAKIYPCGNFDHEWDYGFRLFMPCVIDDPAYSSFFSCRNELPDVKNENAEQWQDYFGLDYEDVVYLVFRVSANDLQAVINGEKTQKEELKFLTPKFVAQHIEALSYLVYAKELAPYMQMFYNDYSWYYSEKTVADLEYEQVKNNFENAWQSSKDKELKLRYGYQLVRLAHYARRYEEAIDFFSRYVESLDYKPAMYYHALSQKAGAEYRLGNNKQSIDDFLLVFNRSNELRETAMTGIRWNYRKDWENLLNNFETEEERNNAYMIMGLNDFNNPLNEIEKITETTPDAVQAKMLIAWTLRKFENDFFWGSEDRRTKQNSSSFLKQALNLSLKILADNRTQDKNFWALVTSYLYFYDTDYANARKYLAQVKETNENYEEQKRILSMSIDISDRQTINAEFERSFYAKYGDDFVRERISFVKYKLAKLYNKTDELGKEFLLHHSFSEIRWNFDEKLFADLKRFYYKGNKNNLEKSIAASFDTGDYFWGRENFKTTESLIEYLNGVVALAKGDLNGLYNSFNKMDVADKNRFLKKGTYSGYQPISSRIFGVNIFECFECKEDTVMQAAYLDKFPFIPEKITHLQLAEILIKLQKEAESNSQLSEQANYLLGNFFYNTSVMGYYRTVFGVYKNNYWRHSYMENYDYIGEIYHQKAYKKATDDELKARIVFALSKTEQARFYDGAHHIKYSWEDDPLITNRKYFKELMKYEQTDYFKEVQTYCKYFDYYVTVVDVN